MTKALSAEAPKKEFFGHPIGLFVLFFTETWERMSYYGMRALLVLYMTKYLFIDPEKAAQITGFNSFKRLLEIGFGPMDIQPLSSEIYGLYTGFVYLSPFFGGILADRIWGKKKTVYVGGALMAIGHFLMAIESQFLPALFFLILGNGCFKPNISTQVGTLYEEGDPRRDSAFALFYMGINLGAFISPFLCDNLAHWLAAQWGMTEPGAPWHIGFGLAGIGMLVGLMIYHWGQKYLTRDTGDHLLPEASRTPLLLKTVGGFFLAMVSFLALLMLPMIFKFLISVAIVVLVVMVVRSIENEVDRSRVGALIILCIGTIAFWAIFEQQGNTLQIWADDKADWAALHLRSTNFQSLNPLMIFIFTPLLTGWWESMARKGKKNFGSIKKMAIGCFLAGAAFLIMALSTYFVGSEKNVSNLVWLVLTTWIFTLGELYLSPIGLSLVTKIAPIRFLSMLMGMWYMSSFVGNYLAGRLGTLYSTLSNMNFFLIFAGLGIAVGFFFLASNKKLQHIISDDI